MLGLCFTEDVERKLHWTWKKPHMIVTLVVAQIRRANPWQLPIYLKLSMFPFSEYRAWFLFFLFFHETIESLLRMLKVIPTMIFISWILTVACCCSCCWRSWFGGQVWCSQWEPPKRYHVCQLFVSLSMIILDLENGR